MALPRALRNHLAELTLNSLHDPEARHELAAVVRFCREAAESRTVPDGPADRGRELFEDAAGRPFFDEAYRPFRGEFCERAERAWEVVRGRPLSRPGVGLGEALSAAADLFDARLFYEVHELLEPYWMWAEGTTREALQGLIQIAVGFHHLGNNNLDGARMLLEEGRSKVEGNCLEGRELTGFARALRRSLETLTTLGKAASGAFDWSQVPRFPRGD